MTEKINSFSPDTDTQYSLGDLHFDAWRHAEGCWLLQGGPSYDFKSACDEANQCHDMFDAKLECATFYTLLGENEKADALFKDLLDNGQPNVP